MEIAEVQSYLKLNYCYSKKFKCLVKKEHRICTEIVQEIISKGQ
jgi:hypothetical protein